MSGGVFDHDPSLLGNLERQVLRLVWTHAPVTAEMVRHGLNLGHKESTIRTVLHRLEKKGYIQHSIHNRTYRYSAVKGHREVAAMAVKHIADWLYQGSLAELIGDVIETGVMDSTSQISKARKATT